jgi:GGDEF domain-containing protein
VKNRLVLLTLPGAAVLVMAGGLLGFTPDSPVLIDAARSFPVVAVIAALLLAWRIQNTRMLSAAMLLGATFFALQPSWLGRDPLAYALFAIFTTPGVALLAWSQDRGFTLARVRTHVLLAFAPLAVAAFACAGRLERATQILHGNLVDPIYTDWSGLPQAAVFTAALAFCAVVARVALKHRAPDVGLGWLVIALACALATPAGSTARGIWFIAGGLVLIIALVEMAHAMAFYDELTGLPGRRALTQALHALRAPYAIAIVDVDHFKSFNDEYGHEVGDQVLRMVAGRLRGVGGGGTAYRSGGEEFTIVFPGVSKEDALEHAQVVREAVASARFALRRLPRPAGKDAAQARGRGQDASDHLQVTISVGVASPMTRDVGVDVVLRQADQAMYKAKTEGRNRVIA